MHFRNFGCALFYLWVLVPVFFLLHFNKSKSHRRQKQLSTGTTVNVRSGPSLDYAAFTQVNQVTGCRF